MNELTEIGKLEGTLEGIDKTLERINKALWGNGLPGAMERITRIEETIERISYLVESNTKCSKESINELNKSITELKEIVKSHVKDEKKHFPEGFLNKNVVLYGVIVWMVLYTLIPKSFDLWAVISKFIGL